ncbi:Small RNA degrading nuclease 5 [Hordeum vulgare]|nr:Small RNA degrading nuclease 5 [Hordeum vulgare]
MITEITCGDAMVRFATDLVKVFGPEYLIEPTVADTECLLAISEAREWPGLLGSLDYMCWKWKNCLKALQGKYHGHVKKPHIIPEAVASHDLWIWHTLFDMPGFHNDINVLQQSLLFVRLIG